jgi:hypothetical protein
MGFDFWYWFSCIHVPNKKDLNNMIVDRISLILAYTYLSGFEATEGRIESVLLSKINNFRESTKGLEKMNMPEFAEFINASPVTTRVTVERNCIDQALYSLRNFTIILKNGGRRSIEYREGEGWRTNDGSVINTMQLENLNQYTIKYNEIKEIYDRLYTNEYIKSQTEYITCGYIQQMFNDVIDEVIQLYKLYKTY